MATQKNHRRCLASSASAVATSSSSKRQAVKIPLSENFNSNSKSSISNNRKRPPLSNLTNQSRSSVSVPTLAPCVTAKSIKAKKGNATSFNSTNLPALLPKKPNVVAPSKTSLPRSDVAVVYKAHGLSRILGNMLHILLPAALCQVLAYNSYNFLHLSTANCLASLFETCSLCSPLKDMPEMEIDTPLSIHASAEVHSEPPLLHEGQPSPTSETRVVFDSLVNVSPTELRCARLHFHLLIRSLQT